MLHCILLQSSVLYSIVLSFYFSVRLMKSEHYLPYCSAIILLLFFAVFSSIYFTFNFTAHHLVLFETHLTAISFIVLIVFFYIIYHNHSPYLFFYRYNLLLHFTSFYFIIISFFYDIFTLYCTTLHHLLLHNISQFLSPSFYIAFCFL